MADVDQTAISRGLRAKALLEDRELKNAFDSVRQNLLDRMEICPVRDSDGLTLLRLQLKLLNDVKANLQSVVNTGKVVEHRLNLLERAKRGVVNVLGKHAVR